MLRLTTQGKVRGASERAHTDFGEFTRYEAGIF
ncbi:Uncharacterised protein [Vibrio cholerae]|uniref:Uncharacterized protein n=1 Tax=Vibrio cholerae TaxID=666 RepID=A0A656A4P2_VIBCL|nr:Uncharacterised protein [Vibrio cholerae]CSC92307.1 Uncharacterised protein [Vibrio cholerae]